MSIAIITGITGQDGAYLAKLLLIKGYRVIGVTRNNHSLNKSKLDYLKIDSEVEIYECDLSDFSSVIKMFNIYNPKEVYNLAAQSSVGLSFSQPIGTIQYNIVSVLNLLEAIRLVSPETKLYQASSSEMYGKVKNLPVKISTPMHPLSPYAISKCTAHWIVVNYRESYGLYVCNGVLFNHESFLRSNNFFVKKVISNAVLNKDNTDWNLEVGNIDVKRDFGYSPKYVEAMWLLLQQEVPKDFIICSGRSISLREIIEYVFNKLRIPLDRLKISKELYRPSEINDIYGDNSDAKNILKWEYNTSFYEVLDSLIEEEIQFINK
jgi:GDPmannose 4,6-dehydratase